MKVDELVILVGGRGTRLGKITKRIPKPLIKIGNRTFLDQLLSKIIIKYDTTHFEYGTVSNQT